MPNRPNQTRKELSNLPIYIEKPPSTEIQRIQQIYGPVSAMELEDPNGPMPNYDFRSNGSVIGEAVLAILDQAGTMIVLIHPPIVEDYWMVPMGRIEVHETIEQGAIREGKEETGYDIALSQLLGLYKIWFTFRSSRLQRWHFLFQAQIIAGAPVPIDYREVAEVKFVPISRLRALATDPWSQFWLGSVADYLLPNEQHSLHS